MCVKPHGRPVGVILTTYGEPMANSFSEQWMYSYRILERLTRKIAPIPRPVLPIIATARAVGRVRMWNRHDFQSPLEPLHEETGRLLAQELERRDAGGGLIVTGAYEFRRPNLSDALRDLRERGCDRAVVVPMYVGGGDFTHGMTEIAVDEALQRERAWSADQVTTCHLAQCERSSGLLAATLAEHCRRTLDERGIDRPAGDWALLLAAHGTVVDAPENVDNGLLSFGSVLRHLKSMLRPHFGLVRVGWLNHTRGGTWTTPAVPEALEFVQRRGYEQLIYFPWGFTTDNAETALEGRIALDELQRPFTRVEYLPCLNTSRLFISLLADRIHDRLAESVAARKCNGVCAMCRKRARSFEFENLVAT